MKKTNGSVQEHVSQSDNQSPAQNDGLDSREAEIVEAIMNRGRKETWEQTAGKIGISVRTLHSKRRESKIVDAVQARVDDQVKIDYADVLKEVARKAKSGNIAAAKLFLEQANRVREIEKKYNQELSEQHDAFIGALANESKEVLERVSNAIKNKPISK